MSNPDQIESLLDERQRRTLEMMTNALLLLGDEDLFKLENVANNHRPNNERAKVKAGRRARLKMLRLRRA